MDHLTIVPCAWRSVPATLIIGAELEVVITVTGGHLACLRRRGETLTPLWQPPWPASAPAAANNGQYGLFPEAPLLATIVGSNLCCDRFGAPRPGERRPTHGETGVTAFTLMRPDAKTAVFTAYLPEAALTVQRRVQLSGTTLILATTVSHRRSQPHAVEWAEHTNIGGAFLDGVEFTADIDRVVVAPFRPDATWRFRTPLADVAPSVALAMPAAEAPACGDVVSARVAAGLGSVHWRALNRRLGRQLTMSFERAEFPWLALWTQHCSRTTAPWLGRTRVRGMELSTKPFPEGQPPATRAHSFLGRPTVCLVPPAGLTKTLRFSWGKVDFT